MQTYVLNKIIGGALAQPLTLTTVIQQLELFGVDKSWCQEVNTKFKKGKQYLKTDYRVDCQDKKAHCADHFRLFALSDPSDDDFKSTCDHDHLLVCQQCDALDSVFAEINFKVTNTAKNREKITFTISSKPRQIYLSGRRIFSGQLINQEQAKQEVIQALDETSVLVVMHDWAMKYVQRKYREKQSDWFGKR